MGSEQKGATEGIAVKDRRIDRPLWAHGVSRRLFVFSAFAAALALSGCLNRSAGSVPLPYVKPANSVPTAGPEIPVQMAGRMQAMEMELQRLWDAVERMKAAGGHDASITQLQERIAFIEKQLGIDAAMRSRSETPQVSGASPPVSGGTNPSAALPVAPRGGTHPLNNSPATAAPERPPSIGPIEIQNPPLSTDAQDYREAYASLRSGENEKAVQLFEAFLSNHPKSDLASSALYWAGEAHFALGHFDQAVLYFDRVLKEHPGSNKELSALLKQGQSFEKMGDVRSARYIFQKLVSDHPHTAQARLAAGRLKALPTTDSGRSS